VSSKKIKGDEMTKISKLSLDALLVVGLGFNCAYAEGIILDVNYLHMENKVKSLASIYDINGYQAGNEDTRSEKSTNGISFSIESVVLDQELTARTYELMNMEHVLIERVRFEGALTNNFKTLDVLTSKNIYTFLPCVYFDIGGGWKYVDAYSQNAIMPFVEMELTTRLEYSLYAFLRADYDFGLGGKIANGYETKAGLMYAIDEKTAIVGQMGKKHFNADNDVDSKFFTFGFKKAF
jgi:hypothetical protein